HTSFSRDWSSDVCSSDLTDSQILMGKMATINTTTPAADTLSNSSSMNWLVSADKIRVDKTNIWFKDDNQPRMKGFDYFNIKISDFLAELDDLYFSSDSISGSLKNLTMVDHSGFSI